MKTARLVMVPVQNLRPASYNPRKKLRPGDAEYEKIKGSIEEFGFADPLVVNSDMTVIGGHQRLAVAMGLGYTEVPCAVVDVDKVREKALNIALNKITGAWDEDLLAQLLKDIQDSDFDLGKTGFDPPEIETLFNRVHSKDVEEDDFDVEEELDHAQELGLVGVKIHPDTQRVNMDDERLMAIYELCERRGLALLMHCGDYRYDYSHPRRLKRVLHEFPQLRICAAHFGGWSIYDLALEYLEDETCLLDMSSSMRLLGLRRTRARRDLRQRAHDVRLGFPHVEPR